jgi:hypothetical protein
MKNSTDSNIISKTPWLTATCFYLAFLRFSLVK